MRLRDTIAVLLAALVFSGSAKADQPAARAAVDAIVEAAAVTAQVAQLAATASVAEAGPEAPVPAEVAMPMPAEPADDPAPPASVKRTKRLADKSSRHRPDKAAVPKALCVRPIGKVETGSAAWYGGRYIGRRTTSGSRLDTIHPTAAHRTLPLNSLARVTNLDNGRSVVVRVTDRGPVSESLLIDMSPRAADELHMKHAGVVPVRIEQVVEVPADPK